MALDRLMTIFQNRIRASQGAGVAGWTIFPGADPLTYSGPRGALMLCANPKGLAQARRLEERCEECGRWRGLTLHCPFGRWPERCAATAGVTN